MTEEVIQKCIEIAGGAKELAKKAGVSYKAVLDWKNGRTGISVHNCLKLEKITEGKVKKEDLLPDYPWDATKTDGNKGFEIAKKMLEMGMSKENIFEATGLSMEEIEKLTEIKE